MAKTVLYIVDSLGLSGKTRTMAHLAAHLDSSRFRAAVCSLSADNSGLVDQLEGAGVQTYVLPSKDGLDFRTVLRLRKLMRAVRAEVVHCYNPRPILYGGLAATSMGIRATVGSLSAFACQMPDREYGFLPEQLRTTSRRNIYRNRLAARLMRYLVTVSAGLGRRFAEFNGLPLDKFRVIPYGADLAAVDNVAADDAASIRQEMGFALEHVVIGSVGRLVEQKDYPTQLKAFTIASQRAPQLRMVIAGGGPLDSALRLQAEELGISDRVRFIGHWERVPALLRSLDIFVLASKFEPFGVALIEAKAAGLPIIATRVNEVPEILIDRESGLLCPAQDPDSMAELFVTLATDTALRARLGDQARRDAREHHSLAAVVSAYQDLY